MEGPNLPDVTGSTFFKVRFSLFNGNVPKKIVCQYKIYYKIIWIE
jgi:hypothetical protein